MKMFRNDYSELAHDTVLEALLKAKDEQNVGYGLDTHSLNAAMMIQEIFQTDGDVHFLVGGTQTNMTMISFILKDYEAVIAVKTAHINVHETGSIEGGGHKILTVDGKNGKIYPTDILDVIKCHTDEHMVKPKLVYISNSTEIGTVYKKEELKALHKVCKENGLYLFIDGARLGVALTSKENDLTSSDISKYSDAFYIGGTKNGLLFGEALVIVNKNLREDFRFEIKHKGAMLAKGFGCGIQFEAIMKDGLYFEIAKNANINAYLLEEKLSQLRIKPDPVETNKIFASVDKDLANFMIETFGCEKWIEEKSSTVVRFVTSFKTTKEDVEEAYRLIKEYLDKRS